MENRSGPRLPRLPPLRLDAHRPAPGVAGRHLSGPDRRGPRAGDQDHPGRGDQSLLPIRHPRPGPHRPPADQVLRAAGLASRGGWTTAPIRATSATMPGRIATTSTIRWRPDWWRERHASDPEGSEPLSRSQDRRDGPKARLQPGPLLRHRRQHPRSQLVPPGGLHLRRRLGERPPAAAQAPGRRLHRPRHRAAERQGLHHRGHQPLSRHGRGRPAHRHRQAHRARQPARVRQRLEGPQAGLCSSSARTWSRATAGATWAAATTARSPDPAVVVHAPRPRSARPQLRRRLRLLGARLRPVLHLPRQRQPGHLRRHRPDPLHGLDLRRRDAAGHLPAEPRRRPGQRLPLPLQGRRLDGGGRLQPDLDRPRHPLPLLRRGDRLHERRAAGRDRRAATPWIRPDAPTSATTSPTSASHETQSHPLYRHIRRLNQIRRAVPALQKAPHDPGRASGAAA